MLNEKALEAALAVDVLTTRRDHMKRAIAAYLSALLPEDAAGLCIELEDMAQDANTDGRQGDARFSRRAASLIQSQAARIAELEAGLERIIAAPLIDHTDRNNNPASIARSLLNKDRQP